MAVTGGFYFSILLIKEIIVSIINSFKCTEILLTNEEVRKLQNAYDTEVHLRPSNLVVKDIASSRNLKWSVSEFDNETKKLKIWK